MNTDDNAAASSAEDLVDSATSAGEHDSIDNDSDALVNTGDDIDADDKEKGTPLSRAYERIKQERNDLKSEVESLRDEVSTIRIELDKVGFDKAVSEMIANYSLPESSASLFDGKSVDEVEVFAKLLSEVIVTHSDSSSPFGVVRRTKEHDGASGIGEFIRGQM